MPIHRSAFSLLLESRRRSNSAIAKFKRKKITDRRHTSRLPVPANQQQSTTFKRQNRCTFMRCTRNDTRPTIDKETSRPSGQPSLRRHKPKSKRAKRAKLLAPTGHRRAFFFFLPRDYCGTVGQSARSLVSSLRSTSVDSDETRTHTHPRLKTDAFSRTVASSPIAASAHRNTHTHTGTVERLTVFFSVTPPAWA